MKARFRDPRKLGRRLVVEGALVLTSPCHLGGADADATSDQPLLRDTEGRPYLPGTTLCGLLRGAIDAADATALFGCDVGREDGDPSRQDGDQSRLVIDDSPIETGARLVTELRDGVSIDAKLGTAAEKEKFDVELLPVGTRLPLAFEVNLTGDGEHDRRPLRAFVRALACLEQGRIRLGARTRRGFGACDVALYDSARWKLTDYPTATREGMLAWIARGLDGAPTGWTTTAVESQPVADAAGLAAKLGLPPGSADLEPSERLRIQATFAIDGSLLVRSGGHDPSEPDATHLHRLALTGTNGLRWVSVLSGTSLGGVLRHRCRRIASTLAPDDEQAKELIDDMFGTLGHASRVGLSEAMVDGGMALRHTRVRIDPWTGGALDSFLFTEDAWYGGSVTIDIELTPHPDPERAGAERALLLLALRDLATGDLAVGGESASGRGRLRAPANGAFATCTWNERIGGAGRERSATLRIATGGAVTADPQEAFETDFAALHRRFGEPA